MTAVTIKNFEELFPEIKKNIVKSSFIAIDGEFTGLHANASLRPSLFDNSEERYRKCRQSVAQHTACQFGLATFIKDPTSNMFTSHAYSFYLCPRTIDDSFGQDFTFNTGAIEFLSDHGFDFNTFLKLGIPYLNQDQLALFQKKLESKMAFAEIVHEMYHEIMDICGDISKWENEIDRALIMSGELPETRIPLTRHTNRFALFLLLEEVRCQFPHLWIDCDFESAELVVKFMHPNDRAKLIVESSLLTNQRATNYLHGFGRIFEILMEAKKPIVGHNMFFDLLFMYHHFYKPLPKSYNSFKRELIKTFPLIFDTKHIMANLPKDQIKTSAHSNLMDARGLNAVYAGVSQPDFNVDCPHDPIVTRSSDSGKPVWDISLTAHDAGFDAYACGYVFIRLAHAITYRERRKERPVLGPLPFSVYLHHLRKHANRINLIRASVHYLNLEGVDVRSDRPAWLLVRSSKPAARISISQVTDLLSVYGKIDVRQANDINGLLVAVPSFQCAREILKVYGKSSNGNQERPIYVQRYNPLKHRKSVRLILWSSLAGTGLITSILLYKLFN